MSKVVSKYRSIVREINRAFYLFQELSNDELRHEMNMIEQAVEQSNSKADCLEENLVKVFAIVKETARRFSEGNIIVLANDYDKNLSET